MAAARLRRRQLPDRGVGLLVGLVLLSGHLEGEVPILAYRVGDYQTMVATLRGAGEELVELDTPTDPAPRSAPTAARGPRCTT